MPSKSSQSARSPITYSPLTVTQALVVRAMLPVGRMLAIVPPAGGRIALGKGRELSFKYATFKRLQELEALDQVQFGHNQEYYVLSDVGRELWAEHCRIEGTPAYDRHIDE